MRGTMQECAYGREPLDLKLLLLHLLEKIWILFLVAILSELLCGGIYFLNKIVFGEGITYEAVSTYYVDYGTDPLTDNAFTYINGTTWNDVWVHSDAFVESVLNKAGDEAEKTTGIPLTAEEIKASVSATLETDLRVPITAVRTNDAALTLLLCRAVEETMLELGDSGELKEINSIRLVISPETAKRKLSDDRTGRACILGIVLGAFFALVGLCLYYMLDDSVYVPETFEYRYGIPMLGTLKTVELPQNFEHLFRNKTKISLLSVEAETAVGDVEKELEEVLEGCSQDREFICMPGIEHSPQALDRIRETDGLLLLIEAGAHDGKRIEHCLQLLKKQDIEITAALLIHEDERLLRAYYLPGYFAGGKGGRA